MEIKDVKLSNYFEEKIKEAVKSMLGDGGESKRMNDIFGEFTVSTGRPSDNLFFYAYTGEELGVPEVGNIYISKK